jgi:hypothetical protein
MRHENSRLNTEIAEIRCSLAQTIENNAQVVQRLQIEKVAMQS